VRRAEFERQALVAQRKSIVLLANGRNVLPLPAGTRVYLEGVEAAAATARGLTPVATPGEADVCLLRITRGGPAEAGRGGRPGGRPGAAAGGPPREGPPRLPGGGGPGGLNTGGAPIDLTFGAEQLGTLRPILRLKPTISVIYMDRPYVIPDIAADSAALVAHFGVTDEALLDVLTGVVAPAGTLPFELPSSMEAVRAQKEDLPHDSAQPLFPFGHGLTYPARQPRKGP
jgi:beta-glucosidase